MDSIGTVIKKADANLYLQKLEKRNLSIYKDILVLKDSDDVLVLEHNPPLKKDDKLFDITVEQNSGSNKCKILNSDEFLDMFITSQKVFLYISEEEKKVIDEKAESLNLTTAGMVLFLGYTVKDFVKNAEKLKRIRKLNNSQDRMKLFQIRLNGRERETLEARAKKHEGLSLSEFLVISALYGEIDLI